MDHNSNQDQNECRTNDKGKDKIQNDFLPTVDVSSDVDNRNVSTDVSTNNESTGFGGLYQNGNICADAIEHLKIMGDIALHIKQHGNLNDSNLFKYFYKRRILKHSNKKVYLSMAIPALGMLALFCMAQVLVFSIIIITAIAPK